MSVRLEIVEYRDFYDVPRIFVARMDGDLMLFDCEFSEELDDYERSFKVYQLVGEEVETQFQGDWTGLGKRRGVLLGSVPVSSIKFEEKKFACLDFPWKSPA